MSPIQSEKINWLEAPDLVTNLAVEMEAPLNRFGIAEGFFNAVTDGRGTVIVGETLIRQLTPDELKAVLAHEFAHAKWPSTPSGKLTAFAAIALSLWAMRPFWRVNPYLLLLAWQSIGSLISAMLTPVKRGYNWCMESGADAMAAKYAGQDNMVAALAKLRELQKGSDAPSDTHPSFSFRILMLNLFPA